MSKAGVLSDLASWLTPDSSGNIVHGAPPVQFDKTSKLATTSFAQGIGLRSSANVVLTTSQTLTGAQAAGATVQFQANSLTATLPVVSTVPIGTRIEFICGGTGCVVQRQGTDTISSNSSQTLNSYTMNLGDTLTFVAMSATVWYCIGGSVQLGYSAAFAASLSAAGYQKLPSGLIVQWGTFTSSSSTYTAVTFPIAFPNAYTAITVTGFDTNVSSVWGGYYNPSKTGFQGSAWTGTSTRAPSAWVMNYIAIGY